jgi:pyruvate dehydrogenase E1 component alpha subunit
VHHGMPLELLFLMYTYNPKGFTVPEGVNALCNQVSLAAQLPQAVGLAWGLRLQEREGVVLAFVGDGGASEGDFFEACNLAGVTKAPVVFVVQNNGWAISTPAHRQTAAAAIADRGPGFGLPSVTVDGNDVEQVYDAVSTAVARARSGQGATLVECLTYRLGAHNTNDDPTRYRDAAEHSVHEAADPLLALDAALVERGLWSDGDRVAHDAELDRRLEVALDWALAQPEPSLDQIFEHVYADPPRRLARQYEAMRMDGAGA